LVESTRKCHAYGSTLGTRPLAVEAALSAEQKSKDPPKAWRKKIPLGAKIGEASIIIA
jgi:hypothetical protein